MDNNQQLKSFIDRIERLNEQKKDIQDDIKEVYNEAKSTGFEPKAIKKVIKILEIANNPRKKNQADEEEYLVETYKVALGIE